MANNNNNNKEQQTRLTDAVQEFASGKTDAFILMDQSGSVVHAKGFEKQLCCARLFLLALPFDHSIAGMDTPVRAGIIVYNEEASLTSPLQSDRTDLTVRLNGLRAAGGGTSLLKALELAAIQFTTNPRENARRVILIFTDDEVSPAVNYAQSLINDLKVRIICVSIGEFTESQKMQVVGLSSPKGAFFLKTFADVQELFNSVYIQPSDPPKVTAVSRTTTSLTLKLNTQSHFSKIEVQLFEADGFAKRSPEKREYIQSHSDPMGDDIVLEGLTPSTKYIAIVRLVLANGGYSKFSDQLPFTTMADHPERVIFRDPNLLSQKCQEQIDRINSYDPREQHIYLSHLNILEVGVIGHGKTSYVVTVGSSLKGYYDQVDITSKSLKSVTKKLTRHPINGNRTVYLIDIFGQDGNNYDSILSMILKGIIKQVMEGQDLEPSQMNNKPTIQDRIHAVVVHVSANAIYNDFVTDQLKAFWDTLIKYGYQPNIIVTKLDETETTNLRSPSGLYQIYDSPVVDAMLQSLSERAQIPREYIHPVVNYTGPYLTRSYAKEKLALNALERVIKSAESYIHRLYRENDDLYQQQREQFLSNSNSDQDQSEQQQQQQQQQQQPNTGNSGTPIHKHIINHHPQDSDNNNNNNSSGNKTTTTTPNPSNSNGTKPLPTPPPLSPPKPSAPSNSDDNNNNNNNNNNSTNGNNVRAFTVFVRDAKAGENSYKPVRIQPSTTSFEQLQSVVASKLKWKISQLGQMKRMEVLPGGITIGVDIDSVEDLNDKDRVLVYHPGEDEDDDYNNQEEEEENPSITLTPPPATTTTTTTNTTTVGSGFYPCSTSTSSSWETSP